MIAINDDTLPRNAGTPAMHSDRIAGPQTSELSGFDFLRPYGPGPRRPHVSSYRVFTAIVFLSVVLIDGWCDRRLPASVSGIVGPISVILWALTIFGSFGIGPVATMWRVLRR